MNRYWQSLRILVLGRTFIVVMLALFYLTAFFLFAVLEPSKRSNVILLMSVVPTWGVFGMATEKVVECAKAGAELGVPWHLESLRNTQVLIIAIFLGAPIGAAFYCGAQPAYVFLLFVPAALGVLIAAYAKRMGITVFAVFVAGRLVARSDIAMQALHSAWFRDIAVVGSLGVLYWWLGLARRTVNGSLGTMTFRSDARHEVNNAAIGESFGVPEAEVDQYLSDLDRATTTLMQDVATAGPTNRTLWAGLGIDLQFKWRSIATGVVIWSVVLIWAHLARPRQAGVSAFLVISGLLALNLLSRINIVVEAWKRRGIEEALMVLTPHWPTELRVKGLLVSSMLQSQGGSWISWLVVTMWVLSVGWVNPLEAGSAVLLMLATSCAGCAVALLAWSRRRCPEISLLSIVALLTCAIGACIVEFGAGILTYSRTIGDLLILLPLIVGAVRFLRRPLQFPVQPVRG